MPLCEGTVSGGERKSVRHVGGGAEERRRKDGEGFADIPAPPLRRAAKGRFAERTQRGRKGV